LNSPANFCRTGVAILFGPNSGRAEAFEANSGAAAW
jgi:hypothetical protein